MARGARMTLLAMLALAACAERPSGSVSAGPGGASAAIRSGAASVAVGPGGISARTKVLRTKNVGVGVGTGGPAASIRPGDLPVRLRIGPGGLGLGF